MGAIQVNHLNFYYGQKLALNDVSIDIPERRITALIGPSGCGKSTFLRCLNRMNDTIPGTRVEGEVLLDGEDIYAPRTDVVDLRRRVGMVFQRPNPFPQSIFDNVAFGPRVLGMARKGELADIVEASLRAADLWDEVKDNLQRGCAQPVAGPAAAAVHRARDRGQARGDPDGRAVLGARPHRHPEDRRADARTLRKTTPSSS